MADLTESPSAGGGPIERHAWSPPRTSRLAWFGGVLLLVFGAGAVLAGVAERDAFVLAVGGYILGVGVPAFANLVLSRRVGPAFVVASRRGEPVTLLKAHPPARPWVAVAAILSTALLALGGGITLGLKDGWAGAWPFVLLGVYLLASTPYYAAGRFGAGDITLDREGVGQHLQDRDQWIAWNDVDAVLPHPGGLPHVLLAGRPGARIRRCRTVPAPFRFRHRWPEEPVVLLDLRRLSVSHLIAAWVIDLYRTEPALRERLGTAQAVEDIRRGLREAGWGREAAI